MACRAVLFALSDAEARHLIEATGDGARLYIVQEQIEARWEEEWLCQLDKAWDGIHRTLTDGELGYDNGGYPLNHAILGGEQLFEGDDYIIAYVTPAQVIDIAGVLQGIEDTELRQRYDKINPLTYGFVPTQMSEEDFDYVAAYFADLQDFYTKAAAAGRAVIFTVDQ